MTLKVIKINNMYLTDVDIYLRIYRLLISNGHQSLLITYQNDNLKNQKLY